MTTTESTYTPDENLDLDRSTLEKLLAHAASAARTAPTVTAETITDDELRALRDEAIASRDDGTRNIACGALNAIDEFSRFACRQACAAVLNARRRAEVA